MHCYICDWSPHGDSPYHNGLAIPDYHKDNRLLLDKHGRTICAKCEAASYDDCVPVDELEHEELEEID